MKALPRLFSLLFLTMLLCGHATAIVSLKVSPNSTVRLAGEVEANYTTTHLFIDEVAGDSIPITVFFEFSPAATNVESVEIFTNLNRRDRADDDANGDGVDDGILPVSGTLIAPGADNHYFKAYVMTPVGSLGTGYQITLNATKTGAYRLTARFRFVGDAAGQYYYYNDTDDGGKRDHALVISPKKSQDVRLYEVNTLNIEASGTQFSQRSTFEDLSDRPGAIHTAGSRANDWNLEYVKNLGINWLWFQPYHPYGWEGRHESAANINARQPGAGASTWRWNGGSPYEDVNYPYALGSPYAVKNFWEIEPRMSASFSGNESNVNDVNSQTNRDNAMVSFQNFVQDADTAGVNIMPDAAFNHTAWDVELGEAGIATSGGNPNFSWMAAQGASGWSKSNLIHDRELRVFTREGDYRLRANNYTDFFNNNIAAAPDRTDFGKWLDVCDIFFGRYAALVGAQNGSETNNYQASGDWIDYTPGAWNGSSGGSFDSFTCATWRYFGQYAPYWLGKSRPSGQNRNSLSSDGDATVRNAWDARGIDGLRCDFGQGLPPQAWEYIINVARSYKWSFVFMAETLDDGAPATRSNRQFDILNETSFRDLRSATTAQNYRNLFSSKRNAFGGGLVLLNTVSHDEDNFDNPWDAVIRHAVSSSQDGVPMIFPGQELGISTLYGYDLMEKNFGKFIPHFKTYNSMMPLWTNSNYGLNQLYHVYSATNAARSFSRALRSPNRYFLDRTVGGTHSEIFATAKYESLNAAPAVSDVVFAFANVVRTYSGSGNFNVNQDIDNNSINDYGIKPDRFYNLKNIAAYTAIRSNRRDIWQWRSAPFAEIDPPLPRLGSDILANGIFVSMNRVPTTNEDWSPSPYEAQYLKLYDVTPPPTPVAPAPGLALFGTVIGNQITFTWSPASDPEGGISGYYLQIGTTPGGNDLFNSPVANTSQSVTVPYGTTVHARVQQINNAGIGGPYSSASASVQTLDPAVDQDGDGQSNAAEHSAGTNPLSPASVLRSTSTSISGNDVLITVATVAGKTYQLETSTTLAPLSWSDVGAPITALGPATVFTALGGVVEPKCFYRVRVVP